MWGEVYKKFNNLESIVSLILGVVVVLIVGLTFLNFSHNKNWLSSKKNNQNNSTSSKSNNDKKDKNGFPKKYTVKENETLWIIAENEYKSGFYWTDIAKENNLTSPDSLVSGSVITLPKVTPLPDQNFGDILPTGEQTTKSNTYTVKENDTLWSVACEVYSNCYDYPKIAKANNLPEEDANLEKGQILKIPR